MLPHLYTNILRVAGELIFPKRCVCCGKYDEAEYMCRKCLKSIRLNLKIECVGCGKSTSDGRTCASCRKDFVLDKLFVAALYSEKDLMKIIKAFKYRFICELATPLSEVLKRYIDRLYKTKKIYVFENNPVLIPVPLYFRRENWRGFNQSRLISDKLGSAFQLSVLKDALVREKDVKPQAETERDERIFNVRNIFRCIGKNNIKGKDIMLVDDICTSGATLNECAKVLIKSGAKSVSAIVIARGRVV